MSATLSLSLSQLRPFACSLGCSIVHWAVVLDFVHNFAIFGGFILENVGYHSINYLSSQSPYEIFSSQTATDSISLIFHFGMSQQT